MAIPVDENAPSTIGEGGGRVWLYPRESKGWFWNRRKITAWILIFVYLGLPWVEINGRPVFRIDFWQRKLDLFGVSFWPQELSIFLPGVLLLVISVFLITMLWGRVWCGWACPQTVFLQFVFEPIEKLTEGSAFQRQKRDAGPLTFEKVIRKFFKHLLFVLFSIIIGNTFLAYFWGPQTVLEAMTHPPWENWGGFVFVAGFTGLFYFIFSWFKEQACVILCPYARFQSVMVDKNSKVVAYDERRGEPRGRPKRKKENTSSQPQLGDCVNCRLCVQVCPTGIDIREGQQLECIACARCIDACDSIMDAWKRPRGLIRYDTLNNLEGGKSKLLRPRLIAYSTLGLLLLIIFSTLLVLRTPIEVDLTRKGAKPYFILPNDTISNIFVLRIRNKDHRPRSFTLSIPNEVEGTHNLENTTLKLEGGELERYSVNLKIPLHEFKSGKRRIDLSIRSIDQKEPVERKITTTAIGPFVN